MENTLIRVFVSILFSFWTKSGKNKLLLEKGDVWFTDQLSKIKIKLEVLKSI